MTAVFFWHPNKNNIVEKTITTNVEPIAFFMGLDVMAAARGERASAAVKGKAAVCLPFILARGLFWFLPEQSRMNSIMDADLEIGAKCTTT